jgi:hypothetical protein
MKITLSFPANGDQNRPEQEVDALTVPKIGELVSSENSGNFEVALVAHGFRENDIPHKIVVKLEECGTRRRELERQVSASPAAPKGI